MTGEIPHKPVGMQWSLRRHTGKTIKDGDYNQRR